jgi:hypothetical protein
MYQESQVIKVDVMPHGMGGVQSKVEEKSCHNLPQ